LTDDDRLWVKSYDQWVDPDLTIPDISYVGLLEQSFNDFPDRTAFHFMGISQTFGDFDRQSRRFANFLARIGCAPGDVVGINLPNTPQYMIAHAGTLRAGCAATGVSPLLSPNEMAYQIADSGARVLVTLDAIFEKKFLKIKDQVPNLTHLVTTNIADFLPRWKRSVAKVLKKIPTGNVVPVTGKTIIPFMDLLRDYPAQRPETSVTPEDTCLIQYTGGTTGFPKGAELIHRNLVANLHQVNNWFGTDPGRDVLCSGFPFFHLAGLALCMWAMAHGNAQILIPDPRNARHICGEIARHRPTRLCNVPSLYQMLLDEPRFKSLPASSVEAIRTCISAAAPLPAEFYRALETAVGEGKVLEAYGMTETGPLLTMNPQDGQKKIGSVGLPLPSTCIKIVDLDTGTREMPLGQEGEIIGNGPQVMKGYYNKPEETAHALREFQGNRWMFTGDIGRMDEDGYVYIIDRAKDMLNVGGFKVFSTEAEETLYGHPAVEYCAFVGLSNPQRPGSELVKAVIQPTSQYKEWDKKKLEDDIISYCRENMAPYKVPRIIEFVDQMPLTAVGKVDKKSLR